MKSLNVVDIIHIKAVCTSWMYVVKHYPLPQSPWLMLPSNDQNNVTSRCFYDVAGKPGTFYTMTNLPRLLRFMVYRRSISKVVLSSDPARNNNFTAAAVFNEKQKSGLAYCKKGYMTWIELYMHSELYSDVLFHGDDQLFALGRKGSLIHVWNLKGNPFVTKTITFEPCGRETVARVVERFIYGRYESYLVESLGEILLVVRTISLRYSPYRTVSFRVYKVNVTKSKLEKVECLDDRVLFVGGNQSVSLSTRDFSALELNSVCFTDDGWSMMNVNYNGLDKGDYGGHDLGVYSLEDKVVKRFDEIDDERIVYPPPFWILP
uniref:uncharacterized protein LOC101307698 n=1 Tax=Fragaria vesca subsp. vesca TaxID=101020 RepID=UPI0005CA1917|nr:PREDICTED: uncharacterized protein LOC101307698 [Fragaria vesca subsp. vesca]